MEILRKSKEELTKYELYKLTKSNAITSMKNCENRQLIKADAYIIYKDADRNGEILELVAIMDGITGDVYVAQSKTFKESFENILEFTDPEQEMYIRVLKGLSRAGRTFINCDLVSPEIAERELNNNPF